MTRSFCAAISILLTLLFCLTPPGAGAGPAAPATHCPATADTFSVPMSDGMLLGAWVFYPSDDQCPWPVIVCRTPYRVNSGMDFSEFTSQGYAVLCQDVRGTGGATVDTSGAPVPFTVFRDDGWGPDHTDGLDTVAWILAQPWCDGNIATTGGSALGITQNMLAAAVPPAGLKAQFVLAGAADLYTQWFCPGGAFRWLDTWFWIGFRNPDFLQEFTAHPAKDSFWEPVDAVARHSLVSTPTYQVAGWYDLFLAGGVSTFTGLQTGGAPGALGNQKLMIGPWHHSSFYQETTGELTFPDAGKMIPENLIGSQSEWFAHWVKGEANGVMQKAPIAYYLMGDPGMSGPWNQWRSASQWPPPSTPTPLYLHPDSTLGVDPWPDSTAMTYTFDPLDPVPTQGGANLWGNKGPYDQSAVENRDDVLVFTSEVLACGLEIAGPVQVVLHASSNRLDTDFTAKLTDVYPDGRSMLVCDGMLRARFRNSLSAENLLTPGVADTMTIDLGHTAIAFAPGHRVRVAISSSNYPRFHVNVNSGDSLYVESDTLNADNTLHLGPLLSSHLLLPVTNGCSLDPTVTVDGSHGTPVLLPRLLIATPNPFRSQTMIEYELPFSVPVDLAVFDVRGRRIRTLLTGTRQDPGVHSLIWDGVDDSGRPAANGLYFYRLTTSSNADTRKLVLQR